MDQTLSRIEGSTGARRHFRYFDYAMAAFVAILLLSNLIGAAKLAQVDFLPFLNATGASRLPGIGPWLEQHSLMIFGAGILFFPVSYVLGDVLTEVYGYANARRCVWAGFFAMLFTAFMSYVVVAMPPAPDWGCASSTDPIFAGLVKAHGAGTVCQSTYVSVFGSTWRIVAASVIAFWAGEFVNAFVLAKMKILTGGRHLWTRTIGSTIFGQAVDSLLFYPIAFLGVWETRDVLIVMLTNWVLKVGWEAVLTPLTYVAVSFLKNREGVDVFDTDIEFSPFAKTDSV
ncbi:MAG: queuosine precursor transporter [Novosphingobium sp.]|jgi:uncharacterized PurR-regulated membrane protein YhhQ (DUF165 family)|nr:queuosine precursor transporter [Novosphingobium sp.]